MTNFVTLKLFPLFADFATLMLISCIYNDLDLVLAGDLHASEITMSDDDRIQLMLLVKDGKLSMEQAVEAVCILL